MKSLGSPLHHPKDGRSHAWIIVIGEVKDQ
jgi:hypothetical protein